MHYEQITFAGINASVSLALFAPGGATAEAVAVVSVASPGEPFASQCADIAGACARLISRLSPLGLSPAMGRLFLSDPANQLPLLSLPAGIPLSVIGQAPMSGTKLTLLLSLASGATPLPLAAPLSGHARNGYTHIWLTGASIHGADSLTATRDLLTGYADSLGTLGLTIPADCVRTWFFVRDIDRNYPGVVAGRNAVFASLGLTPRTHFIASTGIGGTPASGDLVQLDAYAVGGLLPGQIGYLYAPERMNRTSDYGVAFERGTTVDYGDRRHLLISGTASIDSRGRILHPGDVPAQTARMVGNVEALLAEGGATMADVTALVIYLRDPADYLAVSSWFDTRFPATPRLIVHAPVCRPGWLIEMECRAVIPAANPRFRPF